MKVLSVKYDEKPVGLVYIGCFVNGNIVVQKNIFAGNRRSVREQAVISALKLLQECLEKK